MNRYEAAFAEAEGPLVFPYLTAGYPTPGESAGLALAALAGGADGLEIGVPFSDPLADGPVIQAANTAALAAGATVRTAFELARAVRASGSEAPLTLMGYLNPLLALGGPAGDPDPGDPGGSVGARLEAAALEAADAGIDGVILVDLPAEESDAARAAFAARGVAMVYLLAPTSTPERIRAVAERASGFVYLVSVTGITGARDEVASDLREFAGRVRAETELPLAVGFGISRREHVETVGAAGQAAIIGSALTHVIASAPADERERAVRRFIEVVTGRRSEESD